MADHETESTYRLSWLLTLFSVVGLLSALLGAALRDFAAWVVLSAPLYLLVAQLTSQEMGES